MAFEVLAINPGKGKARRKRKAKKGTKTMTTKKRKGGKRRRRRNPSVRGAARAIARRGRSTLAGMNIKAALMGTIPRAAGMFAAKWGAKKFPGVTGGGEGDDWSWSNYLAGGIGGFVAGAIAQNVKPGSGQKVLEGALDLLVYKLLQNEFIAKNESLREQFGDDDETTFVTDTGEPIVMLGSDQAEPGDMLLGDDGEVYMMGPDGYTRPIDESHRVLAAELARRSLGARRMGGPLEAPSTLGGPLESPGALGELAVYPPSAARAADPFMVAYSGRG